jgi:perosamine synthetase
MEEIVRKKRWIGEQYRLRLQDIRTIQLPLEEDWAKSVYWMYGIVLSVDLPMNASEFAEALKARGVDSRPFFLGMHEQPVLQRRGLFRGEHYPVAEYIARKGLYLPSGIGLTEEQLTAVCDTVHEVLR